MSMRQPPPIEHELWRIEKGCTAKRKWTSKKKAKAHARRYKQRIYKCDVCGMWHCTTKPAASAGVMTSKPPPEFEEVGAVLHTKGLDSYPLCGAMGEMGNPYGDCSTCVGLEAAIKAMTKYCGERI